MGKIYLQHISREIVDTNEVVYIISAMDGSSIKTDGSIEKIDPELLNGDLGKLVKKILKKVY